VAQGHSAFITALDWSVDSSAIQSVDGAYEILFHDANNGQLKPNGGTDLRDVRWATWSCKIGWPVQGIFPPGTNGEHVYGVDRNKGGDIVAVADDWGLVNLYRNPNNTKSACISFRGHSSHVTRVQFDKTDKRVFSIGGLDQTVIQWKLVKSK